MKLSLAIEPGRATHDSTPSAGPNFGSRMKSFDALSPSIDPLGDCAAIVSWPNAGRDIISTRIQQLAEAIQQRWRPGLEGVVPAFVTLTLHYNPTEIRWADVRNLISASLTVAMDSQCPNRPVIEIPVCYGERFAPDLADLATQCGLSIDEVIRQHSSGDYSVRMIGFSPGFPYLAGLPEQLAMPRRSSPRLRVPAGSVAIGGNQTGVYSMETPGGWHIIGRTPTKLFLPECDPPCLLRAGDRVRFIPIEASDFPKQQEPS